MPDPAALRGTRFEFGGRRPLSVPPPRVTYRPPQRPLPGLGTVALGKVTRVATYGAFVDFLGYRGLVHISQLQPGQRVERVEDVVQEGHQVVVRVIAVDPERRHINLALVPDAAGIMETVQEQLPQTGASPEPAPPAAAPPAAAPPAAQAPPAPAEAPAPSPAPPAVAPPRPAQGPQPPPSSPVKATPGAPAASPASVRLLPQAGPPTGTPSRPAAPAKGAPSPARKAQPKPRQPASQHASRALHREVSDPAHPMARLLAAAGEEALWLQPEAPLQAAPGATGPGGGNGPLPAPDPAVEALRPVHVAEPEPEPEQEGPATLEALAARFGPGGAAGPGAPGAGQSASAGARSKRDRSREARERQAAILERLRQQPPNP